MRRLRPGLTMPAGEIASSRSTTFTPTGCTPGSTCSRRLRNRPSPRRRADDDLGRLLGKPPNPGGAARRACDRARRADPQHRRAAHRQGHLGADQAHLAAVDAAIAEQMRTLLHDPAFQSLEAAWRGVQWLISSLELDENLQLHLFDVTRDELLADIVAAQGQMRRPASIGRWSTAGATCRAAGLVGLVGLFHFGPSDTDIGLLAALGLIASHAGGPLLAGADWALAGDDAGALAGWQRCAAAKPRRGSGWPRRACCCAGPTESAAIRSRRLHSRSSPAHRCRRQFLWGNASLALALLIGKAFTARGGHGARRRARDRRSARCTRSCATASARCSPAPSVC